MKNKIPKFLQDKLNLKGYAKANKFPNDIKQFMFEYSNYYNWELSDLAKIFHAMKQNIDELPTCSYKNCNEKVKFNWENKLTLGCCQDHSTKASLLETHGVENTSQREEVKLKKIETSLEHYGVSNPSKVRNIRKKAENTMMKKYGYSNPSHSAEILKKKEKIYLERYGETNPNKCSEIKEKTVNTKLEKYGVRHHFHNSSIFKKLIDSLYQQKEYKWKTGEISILQGHEPIVLSELEENGYTFDIVKTDPKDMPEIFYEFEGKQKRYYPDFFIPSENLIIEVKSEYTLNKDFEMNQAKFKAVEDLGFNFKLEVR